MPDPGTMQKPAPPDPLTDSGVHEASSGGHAPCPHCRGTGKLLTVRDYLDEIVAMLPTEPTQQDAVIAELYRRLLAGDSQRPLGDQLAPLFPPDLVTGDALNSKGNRQRDMLWNGIETLLKTFDPDHPGSESMQVLNTHLVIFGHDHSDFVRPDGTVRGVTPDEYILVRNVFGRLMQDMAGERWEPVHTDALVAAYHYAMIEMLHAAQHHNVTAASYGRRARPAV